MPFNFPPRLRFPFSSEVQVESCVPEEVPMKASLGPMNPFAYSPNNE